MSSSTERLGPHMTCVHTAWYLIAPEGEVLTADDIAYAEKIGRDASFQEDAVEAESDSHLQLAQKLGAVMFACEHTCNFDAYERVFTKVAADLDHSILLVMMLFVTTWMDTLEHGMSFLQQAGVDTSKKAFEALDDKHLDVVETMMDRIAKDYNPDHQQSRTNLAYLVKNYASVSGDICRAAENTALFNHDEPDLRVLRLLIEAGAHAGAYCLQDIIQPFTAPNHRDLCLEKDLAYIELVIEYKFWIVERDAKYFMDYVATLPRGYVWIAVLCSKQYIQGYNPEIITALTVGSESECVVKAVEVYEANVKQLEHDFEMWGTEEYNRMAAIHRHALSIVRA